MRPRSLFAAAFVLSGAAQATPCGAPDLPESVTRLGERLAQTRDRGVWAAVAQDAAKLAAATTELAPPGRVSALYQAGAAPFFLSPHKADRRRHAADAVRYMLAAQALAPAAMRSRQPTARLRTAWKRLGRIEGWLTKVTNPVAVTADPPGELVLEPADPAEWAAACGDTPTCRAAARFRLPKRALSVQLRPGRYRITVTTPCGDRSENVDVVAGPLPIPKPAACPCRLTVRDGDQPIDGLEILGPGGVMLTAAQIPSDHGAVTVSAPGYLPRGVSLPPKGGPVEVTLARCPVELHVFTEPPGALIDGDGPAPWGPRRITAQAPHHADTVAAVDIPRPASCRGARHVARVTLLRDVTVTATADGARVLPARLMVAGEPVGTDRFARAPGRYSYQAWHPLYGASLGELEVPACVEAQVCASPELKIEFRVLKASTAPKGGASRWSYMLMGLGGLSMGGGLVSGVAAFNTQDQIDGYGARRDEPQPIDELVERRNTQAKIADGLVIAGASAFALGLVIYLATVD